MMMMMMMMMMIPGMNLYEISRVWQPVDEKRLQG